MEQKNQCPPPLPGAVPPPLPGTTVPPVLPKVKEAMEAKERAAKLKAEEEACRKAAEAEARMKAEIEAKVRAEMEAKAKAEAEAKRKVEEEARRKVEAEARAKAEEARKKAEAEARKKAEEEARRKAEEARKKAEAEAKAKRMVTPEMVINRIIKDLTESICWTEKVKTGMFSSETRVHRYLKCSRPLTSLEMIVICTGEAKDPAEYDIKKLYIPANSKSDSSTPVFQCIRDLAKKYHESFLKEKGATYPYFDHFDWNSIKQVKQVCPQFDGMFRTGEEANHGCSDGPYYPILKLPVTKL